MVALKYGERLEKSPSESFGNDHVEHLWKKLLPIAVPEWRVKIQAETYLYARERKMFISKEIASKGDVLMFGGKKGEAGRLFNLLAEGLAILALIADGGVTFCDMTFDYPLPEQWKE